MKATETLIRSATERLGAKAREMFRLTRRAPHSLSSSLMPVLARVWASTVFTITAQ